VSVDFRLRAQRAMQARYRLGPEIGRGGMAVVYRADDLVEHRPLAVKLLLPEVATHLGVQRFLREIALSRELDHPGIVPVLDTGDADGLPFYVMPLVAGPSLRQRLADAGRLSIAEAVAIAAEVADALAYAHARDVLHRDIKPENLLLADERVVVTDFGVGKALNVAGGSSLTDTGFIVGTPAYMSPEQAAADPELDGRSDLYSLGVVLYEMVGGVVPFTGATAQQVIARRFVTPPRALDDIRDDVPPWLAALVGRLLAVQPGERLASAAELAATLRRADHGPA
jgi:serine/threonine-protein kinase